jgi:ubiquinone/menaquinone biosynthesis C-methylase UbiE
MSRWKQKRTVRRSYDLTAQMYDLRYGEEQEAKYMAALESISLGDSDVVLDVGCGTGMFFRHLEGKVQAVVGVDLSRNLLLKAHKRAKLLRNVHMVLADADHLPFGNGFSKRVFAFTVLQNMPKPTETLLELRRVASPDGSLVVTALKQAFSLEAFGELLANAGLLVASLRAEEPLKCHVVVAVKHQK